MTNLWINYVKKYATDNKLSYKDALKEAKTSYKQQIGGSRNSGYVKRLIKTGEFDLAKIKKPSKSLMKLAPAKKTAKNDIDIIVEEFNDSYLSHLLYQNEKYRPLIDHIAKLAEKNQVIIPYQLFFTSDLKQLLNKLNEKYSIQEINDRLVDLIEEVGGKTADFDLKLYYKHLNAANRKKMIKKLI